MQLVRFPPRVSLFKFLPSAAERMEGGVPPGEDTMTEGRRNPDILSSRTPAQVDSQEPMCTFATQLSSESLPALPPNPLSLLVEVNAALVGTSEGRAQAESLDSILARACERLGLAHAAIYRMVAEAHNLQQVAHHGAEASSVQAVPLDALTLPAWVARETEPLYLSPGTRDSRFPGRAASALAEYAVPLRAQGRMLGVLVLAAPGGLRIVTRKLLEQFAFQVALALERLELTQRLRDCEERLLQGPGERKEAEAECAQLRELLMRTQKLAALGKLVGGLAHEFNNLLGVIMGFASLLRAGLVPDDPLQGHVRMIEQSGERAADLICQLSGYTRQELPPPQPQRADEVLQRVVKIVSQTFDRRVRVETRCASDLPWIEAHPGEVEQMILNLCLNARDAMPEGGSLVLEATQVSLRPEDAARPAHCPPGPYVRLAVQDSGVGIEPRVLTHIFEPFFTTKDAGKGSGLGLSMVDTMVRSQGGFVRAESEAGCGSRFTLFLPALCHLRQSAEGAAQARGLTTGSGTILVVDDEPMVLAFVQEGLRKLGYRVLTADSGARALELYAGHAAEIDCVLLDLILPVMSGLEVYRRLRALNPSGRVIFSTGYANSPLLREARAAGGTFFLHKPYTLEELGRALQASMPP